MKFYFTVALVLITCTLFSQRQSPGSSKYLTELSDNAFSVLQTTDYSTEFRKLDTKSSLSIAENIVAQPLITEKSPALSSLSWLTLDNGNSHLAKIHLKKNRESYILLKKFKLREGDKLFFRGSGDAEIKGAYTIANNLTSGNFLAGPFNGDVFMELQTAQVLETNSEGLIKKEWPFELSQIFVSPNISAVDLGFGASFPCQINVNCDQGQKYAKEKNGVMRIRMVSEEGIALCTGTLMNNTAEDETPYVLTAYHCLRPPQGDLNPLLDMWLFDFQYEAASCANPENEPTVLALQGAEILSEWQETDMMLVKILEEIPDEVNLYFNGWNRTPSYLPQRSVLIHHPAGDIKKVTTDNDVIEVHNQNIPWDNSTVSPSGSHWINNFDSGVYQPGSSGCGLFDDKGLIIGQLHGGPLADELCTIGIGYSGRISESWNAGLTAKDRLSDWLDPLKTGQEILEGKAKEQKSTTVQFIGRVITSKGIAIPNVEVLLEGDRNASFMTGTDGRFVFDNLSTSGNYTFRLTKNSNAGNGLSVSDIIIIKNHILNIKPIAGVFEKFAADVNGDNRISSTDIILITNVLTGKITKFPSVPSWKFEPNVVEMKGNNVGSGGIELQIIGFKMGDVNGNANPRN